MSRDTRYTVIGAGNGGKAMAAHLALMGFPVTLFNRSFSSIEAIKELGGIKLESFEGGPVGFGKLQKVTTNPKEAIEGADLIMVVVPSTAHRDIACQIAPFLKDEQVIILHPGRTGGSIEFEKVLRDQGCTANVILAEAETFIYASRSEGAADVRIFRIKSAVPLAALPATRTKDVLHLLKDAYIEFIDGINVTQDQAYLRAIAVDFFVSHLVTVAEWAERSLDEVESWDDLQPSEEKNQRGLERILRMPVAPPGEVLEGVATPPLSQTRSSQVPHA